MSLGNRGDADVRRRILVCVLVPFLAVSHARAAAPAEAPRRLTAVRSAVNPIIRPEMLKGEDGDNINGPSLIRAPRWLKKPLGRYYLYFAHHQGTYIRLAYANNPEGPYTIYEPGTLHLAQVPTCQGHVASPDVHVDEARQQIRMYFHCFPTSESRQQVTFVATSNDGIAFSPLPETLGVSYFRVFRWQGYYYALAQPGIVYRSKDGLTHFEKGPTLFSDNMRHSAVMIEGQELLVFYTSVGEDPPERIRLSTIRLTPDWMQWKETAPLPILEPAMAYEGVDRPLAASVRGSGTTWLRELRDPCIFRDGATSYLLYSVAGEKGIAIAVLKDAV
jgi:hypothetical protein